MPGCKSGEDGEPYFTMEGLSTQESVIKDLQLHLDMVHKRNDEKNKAEHADLKPDKFPRPEIADPATDTDWDYFISSWEAYKRATGLKGQSACDQLWYCPTAALRKKVFDSGVRPTDDENSILLGIKQLSVKQHNNLINIANFQNIYQEQEETISQFAARINGAANICEFTVVCSCEEKVSYSKHMQAFQFVRGLNDNEIQEKILADTADGGLDLSKIIKLASAIETGKYNSSTISKAPGLNRIGVQKPSSGSSKKCLYCGERWHEGNNWKKDCRGTRSTCSSCKKKGHLTSVCRNKSKLKQEKTETINEANEIEGDPETPSPPLEGESAELGFFYQLNAGSEALSHVGIDSFGNWARERIEDHPEVRISIQPDNDGYRTLAPNISLPNINKVHESKALADTGAQMVVIGEKTVHAMGFNMKHIIPVKKKIKAANMGGLTLVGGVLVKIEGTSKQGIKRNCRQIAYVAKEVERIYLSRSACRNLGIINDDFPCIDAFCNENQNISNNYLEEEINDYKKCTGLESGVCNCVKRELPPSIPTECPFPPTEENIGRLEEWIRKRYRASTFNNCHSQPLPLMKSTPPLELFINPNAKPVACHKPATVPIHFREQVEAELRRDVRLGVLEEVGTNTPTTWCSRMVIQTKKNGKPRRVIDLQPVNRNAVRQTHTGDSPFQIVSEIPPHTYRTTMDAWNGYHSVPIKEEDRHVTTFITPCGRFRYRTTPQGFLAAQDGYNHRFDLITRDITNKRRCVDDSIVWGTTIEEIFFKTCEYLTTTGQAGIIMNPEKFTFCKKRLEFLGFELTEDGVEPGKDLLKSITEFPRPKDISSVRSWFGLVEQVSWAFSKTEIMAPFRHLLSPNSKFEWNQELEKAFECSKSEIVNSVKLGVKSFNPSRKTCLATDWSKIGIGFCLLQKRCDCEEDTPICCPGGWALVFCSSRYTTPAESRYSPVEGECLGVVWALKKAKYFVLGCNNLIVAVDHKPLLGILNDKEIQDIDNLRLSKLKEKTFRFSFKIIHVPGIKNRIADTTSRFPSYNLDQSVERNRLTRDIVRGSVNNLDIEDEIDSAELEMELESHINTLIGTLGNMDKTHAVSLSTVVRETAADNKLSKLVECIREGRLDGRWKEDENFDDFTRVRQYLSEKDGVILYKNRIVIPSNLRSEVMKILHSAHQGTSSMENRASEMVWWPGMKKDIAETREKCQSCIINAPSQAAMPPVYPESPEFPMQKVCSDIAHYKGNSYIIIVDRFSNWISIYRLNRAEGVQKALRNHFITHGVPTELTTDGGPEYVAGETKAFLERWDVNHRLTSAYHPGANLRAELGVRVAKRIIRENTGPKGTLDTDKVSRALLTYRNTPNKDIGMSPAQMLYGRRLRDHLPISIGKLKQRKEWIRVKSQREEALSVKYGQIEKKLQGNARNLKPLRVGDRVQVQNQTGNEPKRWNKSGKVVESLGNQQYSVRMDGSGRVTLRNRRFLRFIKPL